MDAQAQDRCHRIGQTRNVHIYRLISERTIEENILKKATQKRRLGELAIDDAGFTPQFFKQSNNLRDLFDSEDVEVAPCAENINATDMEKAMAQFEDQQDVVAAQKCKAEAKVELADFEEGKVNDVEDVVDEKLADIMKQLRPIERYAVKFLEEEYKPDFEEEVKEAEALLKAKQEEWTKAHEKAMKDEERAAAKMNGAAEDFPGSPSNADSPELFGSFSEVPSSSKSVRASAKRAKPHITPMRQSSRVQQLKASECEKQTERATPSSARRSARAVVVRPVPVASPSSLPSPQPTPTPLPVFKSPRVPKETAQAAKSRLKTPKAQERAQIAKPEVHVTPKAKSPKMPEAPAKKSPKTVEAPAKRSPKSVQSSPAALSRLGRAVSLAPNSQLLANKPSLGDYERPRLSFRKPRE
uniref:Helicase C-terminal domain-containing protein n=1 Tax=Steinernema glaseri TaxID=37863 RepID=A0A1I7ZJY7_9BILA